MGKPFLNFIEEELQAGVGEVLKKALTGEETANYELPLVTKKGERLYLLVNATSRRDAAGDVVGVIGIAQDITKEKRREVEISRLLDDAQRLIDTANAPIFGVDQNMNVTEWNRKAAEISSYTSDEVMGKQFLKYIEAEWKASVEEVLKRAMTGEETANYELPL
jgi:PAS domain-containing protein